MKKTHLPLCNGNYIMMKKNTQNITLKKINYPLIFSEFYFISKEATQFNQLTTKFITSFI